jgi:ACS family hexuronate transporter-like MFS transporter
VDRVRKTVMLVSALIVAPLPLVLQLHAFWPVAVMMGVVMAGHQGFSLSIFSIITDVVPAAKVGRVTAFGAFMGNMGGVLIKDAAGTILGAAGASGASGDQDEACCVFGIEQAGLVADAAE